MMVVFGANAKTVQKEITLSFANDAVNGITWDAGTNTVEDTKVTFSGDWSASGWTFNSPVNMKGFKVSSLEKDVPLSIEFKDSKDLVSYWHDFGVNNLGETNVDMKALAEADTKADQTQIKSIYFNPRNCGSEEAENKGAHVIWGTITLTIEVEVADGGETSEADYLELKIEDAKALGGGNSKCEDGVITFGGDDHYYNPYGWSFTTAQDWSKWKYLVIVPRKVYAEGNNLMYEVIDDQNAALNTPFCYGYWETTRACVYDIANKKIHGNPSCANNDEDRDLVALDGTALLSDIDFANIKGFQFRTWNDGPQQFEGVVYLTNTEPNYRNFNNVHWETTSSDYRREFTKEGYATVCLDFDAAVCGACVYEVVGVDSKDSPSSLYLKKVCGILKAGKAYIIETNGVTAIEDCKGVTFYRAGSGIVDEPETDCALVGTFADTTAPSGSYILHDGKWYKAANNPVGANRAYLNITDDIVVSSVPVGAKVMRLGDNAATGIEAVNGAEAVGNGAQAFNLAGQRVGNGYRGIVIKNGKKHIVK